MLCYRCSLTRTPACSHVARLLVLLAMIALLVGCTPPAEPEFPTPFPTPAAPVRTPAMVKGWTGDGVRSVCLTAKLDFPTMPDGRIFDPIDEFLVLVLEGMGVAVVAQGECDARLTVDVKGEALGAYYWDAGTRYTGAAVTGRITLEADGQTLKVLSLQARRPPAESIPEYAGIEPYSAPFQAAWYAPLLSHLQQVWGPRVLVGALAANGQDRGQFAPRLAAMRDDPDLRGDLVASTAAESNRLQSFALETVAGWADVAGYDAALPYVVKALGHRDWNIRSAALSAFKRFGKRGLAWVPTMIYMLEDPEVVREGNYLLNALQSVTGESMPENPSFWKEWWLKNGTAPESGPVQKTAMTAQPVAAASATDVIATQVVAQAPSAEPPPAAPTKVVTPTSAPPAAAATAAPAPEAKLVRHEPAGKCRWIAYISLTGFAPNSRITVTSDYDEVVCATGKVVKGGHWQEAFGTKTNGQGRLMIDYLHEATGDYLYTFTDENGNQAMLPFHTEPEPTPTPRQGSTPAAPSTARASEVERQVVVKSAILNLRAGPGQNYAVVGQAAQGDKLYPVGRWGECAWLQLEVLGRDDFVWVSGASQFVSLNVPCETLLLVTDLPPTPIPSPAPAARPRTDLLSPSGTSGAGVLEIKNGTDSDGVVILVSAAGAPLQAAYIRTGDSYSMTGISDGTYRLYFSKGQGWDPIRKEFTTGVTRQRFQDALTFVTSGSQYTRYAVTLYGVTDGNAATLGVPPEQFPAVP